MYIVKKFPEETITQLGFDFTQYLQSGETISSYSVFLYYPASGLTITNITQSGNTLAADIVGGTLGEIYHVCFRVEGSLGTKREAYRTIIVQ